jgi:hypothetical protein
MCVALHAVQCVFAEPVQLNAAWKPTVHPKSDAQRDAIRTVIDANFLFGGLDKEQVCDPTLF